MKPQDIDVQRLKSLEHDKGVFEIRLDALVSRMHHVVVAPTAAPSPAASGGRHGAAPPAGSMRKASDVVSL